MRYETPELTLSMPAINAIQGIHKVAPLIMGESPNPAVRNEHIGAYADWED
jgi:hypothetical protein